MAASACRVRAGRLDVSVNVHVLVCLFSSVSHDAEMRWGTLRSLPVPGLSRTAVAASVWTVHVWTAVRDKLFYQFQVCPLCSEVSAYLEYNNIHCCVVQVDPLHKT